MKFSDLMIDIETLGSNPRAPIIQIGACAFNLTTGEIGPQFTQLVKPNFRYTQPDEATLAFWLKQDDATICNVAKCAEYGAEAQVALGALINFVGDSTHWLDDPKKLAVWAMPPSFDIVILEHTASYLGVKLPWRYDACRDLRTLEYLVGASKEDRMLAIEKHDAGADAVAQASTAIKYYRLLDQNK